jgi:hypothetical protein
MTPDNIRKIVMFASDDFADLTVTQTVTVRVSRQEAERLASLGANNGSCRGTGQIDGGF